MATTERCTTRDETEGKRDEKFRSRRCGSRKWWENAEAWDPERWKAMATAWTAAWQNGPAPATAEPAARMATKTCPYCAEEIKPAAIKCKHCRTWLVTPPEPFAHVYAAGWRDSDSTLGKDYASTRRITRSSDDSMVYGVLGGLGRFFGVDPTWLRVAFALGTFFTAIIPGMIVYGILALLIPSDVTASSEVLE